MQDRLFLSTRKGLFTVARGAGGEWAIEQAALLAQTISIALGDPRDGAVYAAVNHGHFGVHLHRSRDGGASWQEIAAPSFPAGEVVPQRMPEEDAGPAGEPPTKPASVSEIWALEPGGVDEPGVLWCGTIPGGLFRSEDSGDSWTLVRSLWDREERMQWFGGGKDDPGLHSICVDPRDPRRVKVAVSCGGVWASDDAGQSWRSAGEGLRAEYMPPDQAYNPNIQDAHLMAACASSPDCLWIQHHNGIFRSTDGAGSWQEITSAQPSAFGFAVAVHPHDPETAWFVPAQKDETRIPVAGEMVVSKTTDGGASFEVIRQGLPQQHAYDIVYRHALAVDDSGERLLMGSSTGNAWVSEDGGASWSCVAGHLPPIYAARFAP